jgi:DNA-binding NtrC family response regulator
MQETFTILVTDTNRHVRDLLRRELESEGYKVEVARDGRELMAHLEVERKPDLIILDPDLQDAGAFALLERLRQRVFSIPVVIHGFSSELPAGTAPPVVGAAFIEKTENTDVLKRVVRDVLSQLYGARAASDPPGRDRAEKGDDA